MQVSIRNNKGFSLVELMVVVAIIGILAAIAVPNFQKFTAKSKQSEAKSELAAVYSAERAFQAEWQSFVSDFRNMGYQPTGNLRYDHGFPGGLIAVPAAYNGTGVGVTIASATPPATATHALGTLVCGGVKPCTVLITPVAPGALTGTAITAVAFTAAAQGDVDGDAFVDRWQIDEAKDLKNTRDDVNN